ncbi:RNA polymerase sigma factor sigB-like isoform X2 [Primulina huaijiensis]|uniref:RNA polymerase sigma factor sigB-like isoform X2 n=1 Tax=Primulina huaijiensis TaxID=1492673 RepID=UPI003CC7513C
MSCLLPQFKCSPDTFAVKFKSLGHPSKGRESIIFRTQCVLLSATSTPTATATTSVLELPKLQLPLLEPIHNPASSSTTVLDLPSFDTHPISSAENKPWTYMGTVGHTPKVNLEATLAAENLLTNEEAVVAAAASEALALARAALKVAKDAAMMVSHEKSTNTSILHQVDTERVGVMESKVTKISTSETHSVAYFTGSEEEESSCEELEFLKAKLSKSIAVRSKRQMERKEKRIRAAEKASVNVVSVKSSSSSRKKRPSLQDIDYSDPLRYFRGTTSSSKLLTVSEEQMLSKGIQELLKFERLKEELVKRYGSEPTVAQWAAAAGVDQKTLRERMNHGILCKNKMIKSNIRLVISIAKNYQGAGMNLQDLVQEGCRGLLRGSEKFDASKGFKFSTYAHWWIKQAVRKSLSDQSRTIRLPFHMVDATYRVKEAKKQLYSENGRHPNNVEVAQATGLSMKRLHAVLLTPKHPMSLDQKVGINQDLKPSEMIADPEAETSEDLLIKQLMREDLAKVLDTLNPREKQVIKMRFGLEDGRMKTLQEIGEVMGVSRERIRQIESCGFRKLKNKKRIKYLQQYVMP